MDLQFLEISYDACDVLVNSQQFVSSAVLGSHRLIEPGVPYCTRVVEHAGAWVLLFDLASCLSAVFEFAHHEEATAVLFASASGFTEAHRQEFRRLAERIGGGLASDRLGLGVRCSLRLTEVPLAELRPVPAIIRTRCVRNGLLGLRFVRDRRSQYLVDVETVAFAAMGLE